jgi:hypothetical protein
MSVSTPQRLDGVEEPMGSLGNCSPHSLLLSRTDDVKEGCPVAPGAVLIEGKSTNLGSVYLMPLVASFCCHTS